MRIIADDSTIILSESAKGFLTDNYEQFIAHLEWKGQGDKIRFIDTTKSDYSSSRGRELCGLQANTNYAFRLMKIEEN